MTSRTEQLETLLSKAKPRPWEWHDGVHEGPSRDRESGGIRTVVPYASPPSPSDPTKLLAQDVVIFGAMTMSANEARRLKAANLRFGFIVAGDPVDKKLIIEAVHALPHLLKIEKLARQLATSISRVSGPNPPGSLGAQLEAALSAYDPRS